MATEPTEPEIPDSDDLPEDDEDTDDDDDEEEESGPVVTAADAEHHGQPHPHRHTPGFPAHDHSNDDDPDEDSSLTTGHDSDSADAQVRYEALEDDHLDDLATGFTDLLHAHGYVDVEAMHHPSQVHGRIIGAAHQSRHSLSITLAHTE